MVIVFLSMKWKMYEASFKLKVIATAKESNNYTAARTVDVRKKIVGGWWKIEMFYGKFQDRNVQWEMERFVEKNSKLTLQNG